MSRSLQRNIWKGLAVSAALHMLRVGGYSAGEYFSAQDDAPFVSMRVMKYSDLGSPPSMMNSEKLPAVSLLVAVVRSSIGV